MSNAVRSKLSQMNNLKKEVLLSAKSEKVEMTLNTESAIASGLLIQRLTELYEDPVEATVRETISNALDAVTQSHSGERPIVRVSAPTSLNPILVIRDNGVGMTYDDLKNVYSKYGASTKIDDLEQIGAYGLGAKAPLAYGTEFTVTSVKDGQRTTIIVAREEMTNYIKIIDSVETDEPSGTVVSIPVSNYDTTRFNEHIDKYIDNPIDKDVDLYINGVMVDDSSFTLITHDALISDGEEKTYGRVWIDGNDVVNLMTRLTEDDIRKSLKFLIGGWIYESPSYRSNRYYRGSSKGIIVELKAGIVGFNSSRDAILENDRYTAIEDLMVKYVSSPQFIKDITVGVNNMPIDDFKKVMSSVMRSQRRWVEIEDNKFKIAMEDNNSYYSSIPRTFELKDFVHNETGYSLNDVLSSIPKRSESTVVIRESKSSYNKIGKNAIMNNKITDYSRFEKSNITDINIEIDRIMNDGDSHSLEVLMFNLSTDGFKVDNPDGLIVTFITDISSDDDIRRAKSSRKAIVRMGNEYTAYNEYNSVIVYTKHRKSDMENMMDSAGFTGLDLNVYSLDEALDKLREYRARHRVVVEKKEDELSTRISKFEISTGFLEYIDVDDISDVREENVIVVTKNNYIDKHRVNMMYNWCCNEGQSKKTNLYVSSGFHKASDIKMLMELGDVLRDPYSDEAGRSKAYLENVHDNVIELNAIRNEDIDTKSKAFIRLVCGISGRNPVSLRESLSHAFDKAYGVGKIAEVDLPEYPTEILDVIQEIGVDTSNSHSGWSLEESAIKHLLECVGKEYFGLLHDVIAIISNSRVTVTGKSDYDISYSNMHRPVGVDIHVAEDIYQGEVISDDYSKMVKGQVESYLEFIKSLISNMSSISK